MFTHRMIKDYNCRVHCDACCTFVVVTYSKSRCRFCNDRVECLAYSVVVGKRYERVKGDPIGAFRDSGVL